MLTADGAWHRVTAPGQGPPTVQREGGAPADLDGRGDAETVPVAVRDGVLVGCVWVTEWVQVWPGVAGGVGVGGDAVRLSDTVTLSPADGWREGGGGGTGTASARTHATN